MKTVLAITFILIAFGAFAQPGMSEEEMRAFECRKKLADQPGNEKWIQELALCSDIISEVKDGLKYDAQVHGEINFNLANLYFSSSEFTLCEKALVSAFNNGCKTALWYDLKIRLFKKINKPFETQRSAINEAITAHPDIPDFQFAKPFIELKLNLPDSADASFIRANNLFKGYAEYYMIEWIRCCHDVSDTLARKWLNEYHFNFPNANLGTIAHFHRSWWNELPAALTTMNDAIQKAMEQSKNAIYSSHLPMFFERGIIQYRLGHYEDAYNDWLVGFEAFTSHYQLTQFYFFNDSVRFDNTVLPMNNEVGNLSSAICAYEIGELKKLNPDDAFLDFFIHLPSYRLFKDLENRDKNKLTLSLEAIKHVPQNLRYIDLFNYYVAMMYVQANNISMAQEYFNKVTKTNILPQFYFELKQAIKL